MAKYLPHGTTFTFNAKLIGGLTSISIPDRTRGDAETTDSASGDDRTFIPGLRDNGSIKLSFRHDPDDLGQKELEANYAAGPANAVKVGVIALPDAATTVSGSRTYTFNCFVTAAPAGDLGLVEDTAAEQSCTLRVASSVVIAP